MTDLKWLEQELERVARRQQKRDAAARRDLELEWKLRSKIHKEEIRQLLAKDGGVEVTGRMGEDLAGKAGTLIQVRRTQCTVEIDGRRWTVPIDEVYPKGNAPYVLCPPKQPDRLQVLDLDAGRIAGGGQSDRCAGQAIG